MPKPVICNDESVNLYGFRIITSGIDLSYYDKNPILLYDHTRRTSENSKDIILPIGKMINLRIENDQLIGEPEFDLEDEFAKEIARKWDKGYLNAASIGLGFRAIEYSEDPELLMQGQTGPTVTKCILDEISITDLPGNRKCVKLSCNGKSITLNDKGDANDIKNFFSNTNNKSETTMKKTIAALNATGLVTLNETAADELVEKGVQAIAGALSAKETEITNLKTEITTLKTQAADAQKSALKDKATALVESALSSKKIVAEQKDAYVSLAAASEEGYNNTKKILDGMKGYEGVIHQLKTGDKTPADLVKEWDDLYKTNGLETLKAENPAYFEELRKAKYPKKK